MALPNQQLNWCLAMMDAAKRQRDLLDEMQSLKAQWNLNDWFTVMLDADLVGQTATAHLTKSELGNALNAFDVVVVSLGDAVSGELTNLIKLQG